MKKIFFTLLLAVVIFLTYIFVSLPKDRLMLSPLLAEGKAANNLWLPQNEESIDVKVPQLTTKSAFFVDTETGQVLYQKEPHQRLPIASLAKIMTAIVVLEDKGFSDEVLVSNNAASMEPDHMQLLVGEKLTVEELLYGVFLVSANDAAEALAESVPGGREEFIKQMNKKAIQLGMKDTLFANPSGLEEDDKQQYSTAYDIALMSRYLIKQFPKVVKISSTVETVLPQTPTHQEYTLVSGINLLTTYPGVVGLKTGFTPEAGLTLVTLARRGNKQILGVLLNTQNRREEARELLDFSFKKLGVGSSPL